MTITPFNGSEHGRTHYVTGGGDEPNKFSPTPIESPPNSGNYYLLYRQSDTIYSQPIDPTLPNNHDQRSEVVSPADIGGTSINGFDLLRDNSNDEWLIFAAEGTSKPNDGYLIAVSETDNSWTVNDYSQVLSGALTDGGPACFAGSTSGNAFFGVSNDTADGELKLYELLDITARPLPSSFDNGPHTYMKRLFNEVSPINKQMFQVNASTLGILYESASQGGWSTQLAFGTFPFSGFDGFNGASVGALTSDYPPVQINGYNNDANFTHPQFSTVLGRPLIFGQRLTGKGTSLDYGIYAYEPDPNLLNPIDKLPLTGMALNGETGKSGFVPTFGADQVRIHRQETTDGTITLHQATNIAAGGSQVSETSNTITASHAKVTFDDPLSYVAVESSVAAKVRIEIV